MIERGVGYGRREKARLWSRIGQLMERIHQVLRVVVAFGLLGIGGASFFSQHLAA